MGNSVVLTGKRVAITLVLPTSRRKKRDRTETTH